MEFRSSVIALPVAMISAGIGGGASRRSNLQVVARPGGRFEGEALVPDVGARVCTAPALGVATAAILHAPTTLAYQV